MDPINSLNPALEAFRRQLAENIDRLRKAGRLAGASPARAEAQQAPAAGLEAILRRRIAAIDPRSPEAKARVARAFVESVLVAEFGEALLADAGFGELLSEIGSALRADAHSSAQLDELLAGFK
jgi:hypothetical protein